MKHTGLDLIAVDTNVLVYLADATDKAKHGSAQKLLKRIMEAPCKYVVCLQNIREFASVVLAKHPYITESELLEYVAVFREAFAEVLRDTEEDVQAAVSLQKTVGVPYWDALLLATLERHGVEKLFTENTRDFRKQQGVQAINPFAQ